MSGTLQISLVSTRVLFDSGSIHLFVSPRFTKKLAKAPVTTDLVLSVATLLGRSVITDQVILDCRIHIRDGELVVDLILLEIVDFVILCMNWISSYYVVVGCLRKKVIFRMPNQ